MLLEFIHSHSGTCSLEQGFKVMLWTEAKNLLGSLFLYSTQNSECRWFKIVGPFAQPITQADLLCPPDLSDVGPYEAINSSKEVFLHKYILQSVVSVSKAGADSFGFSATARCQDLRPTQQWQLREVHNVVDGRWWVLPLLFSFQSAQLEVNVEAWKSCIVLLKVVRLARFPG